MPDQFMCSITAEIMTDPVITVCVMIRTILRRGPALAHTASPPHRRCTRPRDAQADGFTYERSAIEQWLKTHDISPATGVELESKQLIPCHALRSLIREFSERRREEGGAESQVSPTGTP